MNWNRKINASIDKYLLVIYPEKSLFIISMPSVQYHRNREAQSQCHKDRIFPGRNRIPDDIYIENNVSASRNLFKIWPG
jgi:hypothetical protein